MEGLLEDLVDGLVQDCGISCELVMEMSVLHSNCCSSMKKTVVSPVNHNIIIPRAQPDWPRSRQHCLNDRIMGTSYKWPSLKEDSFNFSSECISQIGGLCKKDITPLLMHWSYIFLTLTHGFCVGLSVSSEPSQSLYVSPAGVAISPRRWWCQSIIILSYPGLSQIDPDPWDPVWVTKLWWSHHAHTNGHLWRKTLSAFLLSAYHKSTGYCKKDVTPLLMHWSYVFLALTHGYCLGLSMSSEPSQSLYVPLLEWQSGWCQSIIILSYPGLSQIDPDSEDTVWVTKLWRPHTNGHLWRETLSGFLLSA